MNDLMTKSFMSYVDLKKEAMKDLEAGPDHDLEMANASNTMDNNLGLFLEEAEDELMMDFQALRQKMMIEYKDNVGRRYFTVTGEYPDEEVIDKIISDGNGGEEFLKRAIQEHGKGKVLETVVEIQDRHDAAKEIEKSLLELHQVFLDMAVMVEAQGEQMDDIEHHVLKASHYVKDGNCVLDFKAFPYEPTGECIGHQDRHGKGKVLETVVEIQDRHDAAKEIEKSLLEQHQVFLDMAVMVEAQGEQMDDIEHHVFESWRGFLSSTKLAFLHTTIFFFHVLSSDGFPSPNGTSGNCVLDFKEFPYEPTGECIGHQEKIKDWTASAQHYAVEIFIVIDNGTVLRISNVSANGKKAKIVCGVSVFISVVAENLKNSAWIDDFYRCLPTSDAFNEGIHANQIFSKAEIENAINHSKVRKSLGRGSAGEVYKGDDRYLVYEYCAVGNLSQHLLSKDTALTWERRVKILRDCALGLRYLHHFID
ncbi:hypothetical protein D5086_033078 [Populus alba]|uniref:Uncharacterized protein n=1 Tax=Populus alba TaxID=43335 RepID=A0ACC4AFT4_POPAL